MWLAGPSFWCLPFSLPSSPTSSHNHCSSPMVPLRPYSPCLFAFVQVVPSVAPQPPLPTGRSPPQLSLLCPLSLPVLARLSLLTFLFLRLRFAVPPLFSHGPYFSTYSVNVFTPHCGCAPRLLSASSSTLTCIISFDSHNVIVFLSARHREGRHCSGRWNTFPESHS